MGRPLQLYLPLLTEGQRDVQNQLLGNHIGPVWLDLCSDFQTCTHTGVWSGKGINILFYALAPAEVSLHLWATSWCYRGHLLHVKTMPQGVLYSHEGFFIGLGNGCSCSQLGFFCSTVGISIIFKFLPFRRFLRLPLVFLWAFSHKVSRLVTVITPILVLIHCFTRHSGSFSGAFVKLSFRGPTSPREASPVTLKLTSRLIPLIIPVSTKPS